MATALGIIPNDATIGLAIIFLFFEAGLLTDNLQTVNSPVLVYAFMRFDKCSQLYKHQHDQIIEQYHHLQKSLVPPLKSTPSSTPRLLQPQLYFQSPQFCLFQNAIQMQSYSMWPLGFGFFQSEIYPCCCSFLVIAEWPPAYGCATI